MTPDYAAPEQVRGDAVTTATDVWALGIILHELLTGVRPHSRTGRSSAQVERAILESDPPRPSTSAKSQAQRKRLRGDLDAIVLKALRREPENRYASAEALASDVRRHLTGMPVAARGDAAAYLLRSFLRRYRVAVGLSGFALAALVAGLAGTLWQAHRAREEARKAEQVQELFLQTRRGMDPTTQRGRPVDEREVLARDEERATRELSDQPEVQARLLRVFAQTWYNLGVFDRAKAPAERALALERATLGPRSEEEAQTLVVLGDVAFARHDLAAAELAYSDAHAIFAETSGQDGLAAARVLGKVAGARAARGDFAGAEAAGSEHLAVLERVLGSEDPETLSAMGERGLRLAEWGKSGEAREVDERVVDRMTRVLGEKHPDTLMARLNLAGVLLDLGRAPEGESLARQVEADMVEVGGEANNQLAVAHRVQGRALDLLGRSAEALALFDRSIRRWTEMYGTGSVWVTQSIADKATALRHLGRAVEAEAVIRLAFDTDAAARGDDFNAARLHSALGAALLDEGRAREAAVELGRALAVEEKALWATSPELIATRTQVERANAWVAGR